MIPGMIPGMILRRRTLLVGAASLAAIGRARAADPMQYAAALKAVTNGDTPRHGLVHLDIPAMVENGNSVALTISVDDLLPAERRVQSFHVLADGNPLPEVLHATLGPRNGRPRLSTRIRLANSQTVTGFARCADGSLWSDSVQLLVTLAACLDGL
jgi:sulfur-oxidizing protein SoxY